MARMYCCKNDDFEFVVYQHYHNWVAVVNGPSKVSCHALFGPGGFDAPYFEIDIQKAHFRFKSRLYRIDNAELTSTIPEWFREWNKAGNKVKLRPNALEAFILNGIDQKRRDYLTELKLLPT